MSTKLKPFTKNLEGKQKFCRLLGDSRKITKGLRCGFVVLRPGESIGTHSTKNKEEIIIILKGKALIFYGQKNKFEAKENSFVYIPPHTSHNVQNTGSRLLKYVYITCGLIAKYLPCFSE